MNRVGKLNPEAGFKAGTQPFFAHEVIDKGGEAISANEYLGMGRITEFRYDFGKEKLREHSSLWSTQLI